MYRRIPSKDEELRRHASDLSKELHDLARPRGDFLHGTPQSEIRAREAAAKSIRIHLRSVQAELLRHYAAEQKREDIRIRQQRLAAGI